MNSIVAPRFVTFGALCAAWLAAVLFAAGTPALQAAGLAWFANWGIQIAISITSWIRPFTLPQRYYRPSSVVYPKRIARLLGVERFGRFAQMINPFAFDKRAPGGLEAALLAAETTHVLTLTTVTLLTIVCAARGWFACAVFLMLWNVLFNLYPVALQRRNRARLQRAMTTRLCSAAARRRSGSTQDTRRG